VRPPKQSPREAAIFPRFSQRSLVGAVLLAAMLGCAHGEVRKGVYFAPERRYRIRLPAGAWDRISVKNVDLVVASRDRGATILAGSYCDRYADTKLDALARNLFLGVDQRRVLSAKRVALPAGEAERIDLQATIDGVPFRAEAYTLRQKPCILDFVYLAIPERFEEDLQTFRAMMETLRLGDEVSR
jgi:hypothetical protein